MLRLFLRSPFRLLIELDRSFPADARLLHDTVHETPKTAVPGTTVSYLVESYGLSLAEALNVVRKFTTITTDRADCFLSLLRSYGFTQSQIANVVTCYPGLLTYDTEKIIMPKFNFFINVGYSSSELVKIVSAHPRILCYSLEKKLRTNFYTLRSILGSDRKVAIATGRAPHILGVSIDRVVLPNMKTLRDIGVPQCNIVKIASCYPDVLTKIPSSFNTVVGWLKEIEFDASKPNYILGLNSVSRLSPFTWEKKIELYRSLGWSDETIFSAFRKYPHCMSFSEGKILKNLSFFLKEMKSLSFDLGFMEFILK